MSEEQIKHMVDRFLMWKLPESFNPDAGISFQPTYNEHTPRPMKHEPTGTNLLDATQAEAMVRHMLEGLPPCRPAQPSEDAVERAKRTILEESSFNIHGLVNAKTIVADNLARAVVAALAAGGADRAGLSQAAQDVLAERKRQIDVEGWSPDHDDDHANSELAAAAVCYIDHIWAPGNWPWDWSWFKPRDRRRDLVRAGALILAEIERLDRRALTTEKQAEPTRPEDSQSWTPERPTEAEFDILKQRRDEAISAMINAICEQHGLERSDVSAHVSHAGDCYCDCPDGPCQHIWDGPDWEDDSAISVTCSRCGTPAIFHDMRCGP